MNAHEHDTHEHGTHENNLTRKAPEKACFKPRKRVKCITIL